MDVDNGSVSILYVGDPVADDSTAGLLDGGDPRFVVRTATHPAGALGRLSEEPIDCVVGEYDPPDDDEIRFLEIVREGYPGLPFILFADSEDERVASDAI